MIQRISGRDRSFTWHVYDVTANRKEIAFSGNAPKESEDAFREAISRGKQYQNCPMRKRGFCNQRPRIATPIVLVTVVDHKGQIIHSSMLLPYKRSPRKSPKGGDVRTLGFGLFVSRCGCAAPFLFLYCQIHSFELYMNTKYIALAAVAILAIGAFAGSRADNTKPPAPIAEATPVETKLPNAWVEVVSASVSQIDAVGAVIRELQSGDEIVAPATIKTGVTGQAIVHMADGSVLRIDKGTTVTIKEASFNTESQQLLVRVTLAVGRVWSKIIELTTPDSVWEVETSTAVATVRGTAFSMDTDGKKSRVIGSQNSVTVNPIDQKTRQRIAEKIIEVKEETFVEIAAADIEQIKENRKEVRAARISAAISADVWFRDNESSDTRIEARIEEFKAEGLTPLEIRQELRGEVQERFETFIEKVPDSNLLIRGELDGEVREELINRVEEVRPLIRETIKEQIITNIETQTEPVEREPLATAKPVGLEVLTKASLENIEEGMRIPFRAVIRFSDGSVRDVTASAKWGAGGQGGGIVEPGVFVGRVADAAAESGEATAVVFAIIDTPAGQFTAKSPSFTVRVKIGETSDVAI